MMHRARRLNDILSAAAIDAVSVESGDAIVLIVLIQLIDISLPVS